jgi:hypothetical protein
MRVPDGRIFDVEKPLGVHEPTIDIPPDRRKREIEIPPKDVPIPDEPIIDRRRREPAPPPRRVPEPVPARLLVLLAACTALLAVGLVYPWDDHRGGRSWLHPFFGTLPNAKGGALTALSPAALVLVAAAGLWLASRRRLGLAAGLLVGCGLAGAAKYLGLIGRIFSSGNDGKAIRADSVVVFALVALAAFALIPAGVRVAQLAHAQLSHHGRTNVGLFVSGLLVLGGCLLPFNGGGDEPDRFKRAILPDESAQAIEPLVLGIALIALAFIVPYLPRALAAGMLVALGFEGLALWIRYLGIPLVEDRAVASLGVGGFLGAAGAAVALVIGARLALAPAEEPVGAPAFTA